MKTEIEKSNIIFVKLIERNPCIWDINSEIYRNKLMVKDAWHKISKALNIPIAECPERWRKIRDAQFRSIKRHSQQKSNRKKKPYYLAPYLKFIIDLTKSTNSSCFEESIEDDDDVYSNNETTDEFKPGPFLKVLEESQNSEDLVSPAPDLTNDKSKDACNEEQQDEIEFSVCKRRKYYEDEEDEDDSDLSFFKSLLRDVRKMNDKQNRKFRLKVMQVIDEILDVESEEVYNVESVLDGT